MARPPWHSGARLYLDHPDPRFRTGPREVGTGSLTWLIYFATTNPLFSPAYFSIEIISTGEIFSPQDIWVLASREDRPPLFDESRERDRRAHVPFRDKPVPRRDENDIL